MTSLCKYLVISSEARLVRPAVSRKTQAVRSLRNHGTIPALIPVDRPACRSDFRRHSLC